MDRRKFICETLKYIDDNFGDKMVLDELAEISGYSIPQFSRLFTEFTGITPMRYVSVIRIQNSTTMLSETDKSITEIAFACGFDTLEVFERSFKKYFGISASNYRLGSQISATPFYLSEQIYYERLRNMAMTAEIISIGAEQQSFTQKAEIFTHKNSGKCFILLV